jgi:hypothetical protein
LTYRKVKPNVTFCLCWRSSGAEQLPCKQWVGGSNPPASASFFEELPGAAGGFGEVPKWPKGADCKSAGVRLRGFKSSPPHHFNGCLEAGFDRGWAEKDATARGTRASELETVLSLRKVHVAAPHLRQAHVVSLSGGNSSAVERQPSKLGVAGSNPVSRSRSRVCAHVAQSAERVLGKDEVSGSIPDMGSRIHRRAAAGARTKRICELQDVAGLGPRRPRRA